MSNITNTRIKTLGDYTVEELATFTPQQLAGVSFNQQFSPITNTAKVRHGETWETIDTTWGSEVRTWNQVGSLMTNTRIKTLGSHTVEEIATFTPEQLAQISFNQQFSPITNTRKPV